MTDKSYLYRLIDHSKNEYYKKGYSIKSLEGFREYLERKLAGKNGIWRGKLPIYLKEDV